MANRPQKSMHFGQNVKEIIGIFIILCSFGLLTYLVMGNYPKERENMAFAVQAAVTGIVGLVVGYYFGNSHKALPKTGGNTEMTADIQLTSTTTKQPPIDAEG